MEILNVVICFVVKPTQYLNVKLLRREIKVLERHLVHLEFGIVYLNMWQMLLPVVLLPAVCVASPDAHLSISPLAIIVTALAVTLTAVAYRNYLSRPQQKSLKPAIPSVLQRDELQERLAKSQPQQCPVGASVSLKKPYNKLKTGSVLGYDSIKDSYEVKLSTMETVTLQASELELPTVSGLFVYPVKSCAGISMDEVKLTPKGLLHDREWVIIDGDRDKFVTQRRYSKLALVRPKLLPNVDIDEVQSVVLTAEGMPKLEVPVLKAPEGQVRVVSVWKDKVEGVDQGDAAAKWLDTFLKEENKSFRLVRVRDGFTRHTKPKYAPGHATNFADAFPFLLALEESLTDFNEKLEDAVPMNRFRPNIVLRGSPPFTDEHWNCITIGGIQFRNVRPCARCGMPSVDQATGIVHPKREPSRAIVRERNGELLGFTDGKKVEGYFGSNMVVEFNEGDSKPPKLTIGASVKVLTLKKEIVA
ncbi:hypothetical protein JM16_005029 [Phytophthora kernoviae]|uniref:MOSC domain-containing protein n=1 Tax=Phytophthora kernoviae TaxID=325452 RepID=A0A8T0LY54_9STRA|nr:hypothetical protein JM16_005029 [Phytophthora kernoviae]